MFTITVRRSADKQHYTIKGHAGGLVTLPRPLTVENSGLSEELIEKIVTCRRSETRDITAADALVLDKFAPPVVVPTTVHVNVANPAPPASFETFCKQHGQVLRKVGQNGIAHADGPWGVFEVVWSSFTCQQGDNDDCAPSWVLAFI